MYKELSTKLNFPELEKEILEYWDENKIFEKSIENRDVKKSFVFYEGPPTANGQPGIHHVLGRTIKDFVCRLKTMEGYRVERKAGWDTHGLPVEIQVEKELGFSSKEDIEKYGIDKFNKKCRESVWKYKSEWDEVTRRIAFWLDLENPYITYENNYIESVWWILSELWKKELIYRGHKIVPYCPRCETPLSSHEVAQGYKDVEDPSVFVRMRIKGEENTSFLVWTTTPWTLISNVALVLNPEIEYVKVKLADEHLILAKTRLEVLEGNYKIVETYTGKKLTDKEYEPPYFYETDKKAYYTVLADFVSTVDGTGIVHMAPAFGEDDYQIGLKYDLPVLQPVDESGKFTEEVTKFKSKFVKDADPEIIKDLESRGLLYKSEAYLHSYPHCWRCTSPLLYFAKKSWFVRTTAMKERLIKNNDEVDWYPKEVGEGRFGEWLKNNIDWSLSRDRYWGTPLPIWVCEACNHEHCIGGVEELKELSGLAEFDDLHKPYIDEVEIKCSQCSEKMTRTPEVIDCWFDSGSMPIAQWHYPFENKDVFERSFPADFIAEGVDQTRGWFYSLHAIATMLFEQPCYKVCVSNDLILDKFGQKMSKSKENTVDPKNIIDEYGADAVRWYLLTVSPPWVPTKFDVEGVNEVVRKFFGTLVNVYSFFTTYANIDKFKYEKSKSVVEKRAEIDRWLLSSLNGLVEKIENHLSRYDLTKAARLISEFVIDDLSNWYVREMGDDKLAAYETLYETLIVVSKLLAPYAPFISEEIHKNLTQNEDANVESVHLTLYPKKDTPEHTYRDTELEERMDLVRRVVFLGRALRNESAIKVRQPLSRIVVVAKDQNAQNHILGMASLITEELNIKNIEFVSDTAGLTIKKANPLFKQLGPRFGKNAKMAANMIRDFGEKEITELEQNGEFTIDIEKQKKAIKITDLEIVSKSAEGLVVQADDVLTAALDTRITDDLRIEGLAREFVNRVQNMRKNAGFDVIDRIKIYYETSDELLKAIAQRSDYICNETLAESLSPNFQKASFTENWEINGSKAAIGIEKVV